MWVMLLLALVHLDGKPMLASNYRICNLFDTTHTYDVLHYRIALDIDPSDGVVNSAQTTINLRVTVATLDTFDLYFAGMIVDSVFVDTSAAAFVRLADTLRIVSPIRYHLGDSLDITVFYHGEPSHTGGFGGGLYIRAWYVYTSFNPDGPRYWFPCYDYPWDKATAEIIVTLPVEFYTVANGKLISVDTVGERATYHWYESYPIATYLIAIASYRNFTTYSDTVILDTDTLPIYTWLRHYNTEYVGYFEPVPEMVEYFSQLFGMYPFMGEKFSNVDVPLGYAMENQTCVFIDLNVPWSDLTSVIAHELSHQWWGDCVTLGTWADVWLNEGFATYCEALWAEHVDGFDGYIDYMQDIMQTYLSYEPYPPYPIYNPGASLWQMYSVVTYEKGASVLHMLRYILGDSTFFNTLRTYFNTYAYGNAVTSELQQMFESTSGQDLDWFFTEWVYLPGHPIYKVYWSYQPAAGDTNHVTLRILQIQSHNYGVPTYIMPIEVLITTTQSDTMFTVWDSLDDQWFDFNVVGTPTSVKIDPTGWLLCEKQVIWVDELPQVVEQLRVTPTVSDGQLHLQLMMAEPYDINISIVDILGRPVYQIFAPHTTRLDRWLNVSQLPAGCYFIRVDAATRTWVTRVLLLK